MPREKALLSRSAHTMRSSVSSTKLPRPIRCESLLERTFVLLAEFSRNTVEILEQPEHFYVDVDANRFRYTPDFRVVRTDGTVAFIEIKDQRDLAKPGTAERLNVAKTYVESQGFDYLVRSDIELRANPALLQNVAHLKRFRTADPERLRQLSTMVPLAPSTVTSLSSLVGELQAWELVANQLVFCDLAQFIEPETAVSAMRDHDHACFY